MRSAGATEVAIGEHSANQVAQANEAHNEASPHYVHPNHFIYFMCFDS